MFLLQPAGRFAKSWGRNQSPWRRELKAMVYADMQGGLSSRLASGLANRRGSLFCRRQRFAHQGVNAHGRRQIGWLQARNL
jgi:hypothetical protein